MRWNESVVLLSPAAKYQDAAGAWHEDERTERTVFCNERMIGTMILAHLRSSDVRATNTTEPVDVGLRNEHMLEVRAIDYGNEDQCIYHGDEYEVLYVSGSGETRLLTIGQRLGNSA